jgi:hypothetical protein
LQDNLAGFAPHPARPFDIDAVTGIVTKCAKRQLRLFIHCRDIDLDDLVSEGVAAAAKVHPKYNPAKGAYTTWVYRAARSRMIDIARSRTRQAKREDVAARDARDRHAFIEHPEIHVEEQGQDLAEWLANVYRAIKAVRTLYTPPPPNRPPPPRPPARHHRLLRRPGHGPHRPAAPRTPLLPPIGQPPGPPPRAPRRHRAPQNPRLPHPRTETEIRKSRAINSHRHVRRPAGDE